jgi:hypothetical protein
MNQDLAALLEESTRLELTIARLYRLFHKTFEEDSEFWRQLYVEEGNHAALIRSAQEILLAHGRFPADLLAPTLQAVRDAVEHVESRLREYVATPPSREAALSVALELELSAGEAHYQAAMESASESDALELLRKLNGHDRDHARRLREYAAEAGIALVDPEG